VGYFFWDPALDLVRKFLESSSLLNEAWQWLESIGAAQLKLVLAPLLVIFGVTPIIVVLSLLGVAFLMTPFMVKVVALRRFPALEERKGATFLQSVLWSLGSSGMALVALVVSVPLWLVPPLILVLPPLIWGWLTYRVMAFDALAAHATAEERQVIFRRHRVYLMGMGMVCGYMGAAPSVVWASGAMFAAAFVLLVPLAVWIYTLVFAFSSLWFAHYCLAALQMLRAERGATPLAAMVPAAAAVVTLETP
jgi:hypothetical protein